MGSFVFRFFGILFVKGDFEKCIFQNCVRAWVRACVRSFVRSFVCSSVQKPIALELFHFASVKTSGFKKRQSPFL